MYKGHIGNGDTIQHMCNYVAEGEEEDSIDEAISQEIMTENLPKVIKISQATDPRNDTNSHEDKHKRA